MSTFLVNKSKARDPFKASTFNVGADKDHPNDLAARAAREIEAGGFKEAEKLLHEGLKLDPNHTRCLAYMAVCMAALGTRTEAAEKMARQVIGNHPDDPAGWYALAQVHLLSGNRAVAFQHFGKARELARRDSKFRAQVDRQDPRNPNVIGSLPRDHFLNVLLGRVRALFVRKKKSD